MSAGLRTDTDTSRERRRKALSRGPDQRGAGTDPWCFTTPACERRLLSMTRWLVTLAGDAADLDRLVELPDGDVWQVVRQDKRGVVLCGARFEALDDHASLRRAAEDLIEHLNRAARHRLTEFQGVTLGATVEQVQGGDHLVH